MKNVYLLTLLTLIASCHAYAAATAGCKYGTSSADLSLKQKTLLFYIASYNARNSGNTVEFTGILRKYPNIIRHTVFRGKDHVKLNLLERILLFQYFAESSHDCSFFIRELAQRKSKVSSEYILNFLHSVCTGICVNLDNNIISSRIITLTKTFHSLDGAILVSDERAEKFLEGTDTKTPQTLMQAYATRFLESKECTQCQKPWSSHDSIDINRMVKLREALQLK